MEQHTATPAKTRSRYTQRVRSLDLPTVRQAFRKSKTGEREEIWLVDGRDHDGKRYRLTEHSKIDAEAIR